jgi:hypothetical protein
MFHHLDDYLKRALVKTDLEHHYRSMPGEIGRMNSETEVLERMIPLDLSTPIVTTQ